jgi:hypothetical protein
MHRRFAAVASDEDGFQINQPAHVRIGKRIFADRLSRRVVGLVQAWMLSHRGQKFLLAHDAWSTPCRDLSYSSGTDGDVAKKHPRRRLSPIRDLGDGPPRYWHAGWAGRRVGEVLLPLARQQNAYATMMRRTLAVKRAATSDPDLASGHIYDINKLFVTSDRSFAEAWSILMPGAEARSNLAKLGLRAGAFYEVQLLDASGDPLQVPPEPDPDYPLGGSFQVDQARVIGIHRGRMTRTEASRHFERMAGRPGTEPT